MGTKPFFYRVAKLRYKGGGENYWYLNEPMNDDVYVKATVGCNISGSISYTINWAYSPASACGWSFTQNNKRAQQTTLFYKRN